MDTSICHNAHLGERMGEHRALYQIGGISPGQKNDFTTARPVARPRLPFRVKNGPDGPEKLLPNYPDERTSSGRPGMSQTCQQRSLHRSKLLHHSITRQRGRLASAEPERKASLTHLRCDARSRAHVAKLFA